MGGMPNSQYTLWTEKLEYSTSFRNFEGELMTGRKMGAVPLEIIFEIV